MWLLKNFRESYVFHCLVINVHCFLLSLDSLFTLPHLLLFVKNFFEVFQTFSKMKFCHPCWRLDYFIIDKSVCQQVFYFIFYFKVDSKVKNNGEGGIWTLAPRKRPIPLAGAPLRPLEYFSGLRNHNLLFNWSAAFFKAH